MEKVKLLDVCDVYQPKNIATKEFVIDGGYVVYGANGPIGRYTEYNHEESEILMACRGATCGAINVSEPYSWINGNAMVVHPNGNVPLMKKYLMYFLMFANKESIITGTAQPQITRQNMREFEIVICSEEEQKSIVTRIDELFSELDNGVETLRKTKQQLVVYRQAVLKDAFESCDNKVEQQFGETLVEKPRNGYSPKGVDFQTKYRNLTLSATTSGSFKEDCFKYIDIDISDDSYLWVKRNDILIQRANTIEYVGTAVLYQGEDDQYVYPDLMMKCHAKEGIIPQFLVYQLQSANCKKHFRNNATGTSGSMPKINQKTVMNAPIIMVPYEDQKRIVAEIEARLSVYDSIEQTVNTALQQAEAMRQSILKQAFEGKL